MQFAHETLNMSDLIQAVLSIKFDVENIKNTCNLYNYIKPNFDESFYVDGVHLSNKGHAAWSESIFSCLNRKN